MFAVEMRNIIKHFGTVTANDDVTLRVRKGEIHALVGENGAGKSTLMNLLYGIGEPDSGEIFIDGSPHSIKTPAVAINLGIGMVHQHFMLVPPLTVADNITLGNEPVHSFGVLDKTRAQKEIQKLSDAFHFNINPNDTVGSLSVGMQQRVEILKLLYRQAEIIILDEPTAILTPQEVEEFFQILRKLKDEHKTIIFISHKVREIISISDHVTVMRKGKVVADVETSGTNENELARTMVGKDVGELLQKSPIADSKTLFRVEGLSCGSNKKLPALKNVSFTINSGEILGVAAVEGNGQSELIEVLNGLRERTSGRILVDEKEVSVEKREARFAHIPEDRLKHGLVLDFTLEENLILGRQREPKYSSLFGLNRKQIKVIAQQQVAEYNIYPASPMRKAKELSGGNQQKVVIARELTKNANVIIASHPTRGLDVGAAEFVHQALLKERNKGRAVLLVSSDLTELLAVSDRVVVLYNGGLIFNANAHETSERELGLYMTGAKKGEAT